MPINRAVRNKMWISPATPKTKKSREIEQREDGPGLVVGEEGAQKWETQEKSSSEAHFTCAS
jgi:hypothetical protein